ncbi:MAG: complex I subunit 5 family protein [Peptococcia bacterium]|jgi:multicomponent Na+:H+ antiporter subunit D
MREQLPVLMIIVPLLTALLLPLAAYISAKLARGLGIAAVLTSFLCALCVLIRVITEGTWHYYFGNWLPPWGIEYVLDPLAGVMAVLIAFLSLVVLVYSGPFLREDGWLRKGIYHALYLLLTAGLLGMVVTGDVFNLYVFLEISSLSAYGLIAAGGDKATVSAFRYVLVGTVGASFYLLGVGYLYAITGSLNMADLAVRLKPLLDSQAVLMAMVLIMVGMGIKMALFPMHGWLPDAYTYASPAVIPFISGAMTKVMVYVLFRYFFFVFGVANGFAPLVLEVLGWLAAIGIILGSLMAMAQTDLRRMLAYSSVAQVGYIALGLALGNMLGFIGAIFHIINHAFMKCCLFLVSGGIKWKTGEHLIAKYAELGRKAPLTMGAFLLAAFSMVGLPPTAGFFSKWYLILAALEKDLWLYVVVIVLSSLLNAVYFFRVIENAYLKKASAEVVAKIESSAGCVGYSKKELPLAMMVPIVVMSAGILLLGILNEPLVTNILLIAFPGGGR